MFRGLRRERYRWDAVDYGFAVGLAFAVGSLVKAAIVLFKGTPYAFMLVVLIVAPVCTGLGILVGCWTTFVLQWLAGPRTDTVRRRGEPRS